MLRMFRLLFRLLRLFSVIYTLWRGSSVARTFWLGRMVWRILRRRPGLRKPPRVAFTVVGARSEEIYRRRGWRRVQSKIQDE